MPPTQPLMLKGGWAIIASLTAGFIAPFSLAPYFLWPLGILSLALLFLCLHGTNPWQGFWRGGCYGLGLFGSGVSWVYISIHLYGNASPALAGLLTSIFVAGLSLLFCASFGYSFARWVHGNCNRQLIGFAGLWVLFEWLRSWLFTGFPWLLAGYAHGDTLLRYWAPIGGVYLLSFFVVASSCLTCFIVAHWRLGHKRRACYGIAALCIPWLGAQLLSMVQWTEPRGDAIPVALFQPNITQDIKWLPEQRTKTLSALQRNLLDTEPGSLLVWPENAIPAFYHQARSFTDSLAAQARRNSIAIITGIPYQETNTSGDRIFYNSIVGLGLADGVYHKQKLVPFGEYVPLESWLRGLIGFFDLPMSNFGRGPSEQTHISAWVAARNITIAPYICYEVVYPDFARKLGGNSSLMLTISDDSWFGSSIGPFQHLQMARMRAVENGRYLVRATNTGVTAIISPLGEVIDAADQFERASLHGEVWSMYGTTPFAHVGSWPVLLLCAVCVMGSMIKRRNA